MTSGGASRRQFLGTAGVVPVAIAGSQQFRDFYIAGLRQNGIVGSSFLLLRNREQAWIEFYGSADADAGSPVGLKTCYHWASITKTLTAIAVMQLRDRGRLRLDDPVVRYIPELEAVHSPYGPVDSVTIRHLLTHSAGFRSPTWPWRTQEWQPFEPTKWSQIVAMLPYTNIEFPPGSRHSYSNLGIVFLGQIIERLTDDDYEIYVDKNILKPLEMHESYFDTSPYHLLPFRSHSYYIEKGQRSEAPFNFDTGITVSNGGLNAPFGDMQRYLQFLVGNEGDLRYEVILKRSSLEEMFGSQLPVTASDSSQAVGGKGTDSIGLGFFRHQEDGKLLIGHGGNQNGFISHFYFNPKSRHAYLVAFNTEALDDDRNTARLDVSIRSRLISDGMLS